MKRITISSLSAFALMVIIFVGVRLYLHSARTLANVTRQVADAYGGPVTIDRVDIGLMSTTISGLRMFEPGADVETANPWLTAHSVIVDEPLWRLGRGDISPTRIGVQAAEILLRFDEKGDLITRFPTRVQTDKQSPLWDEIPPITIEQAKVILRQDGRDDLAADNIRAEVAKKAGEFVLSGNAESQFGNLTVSGSFDKKALMAQLRVKTDSAVHVTQNLLEHLPFVPAGIFQELKIERADATGSVALTFDLVKKSLRYRIDLAASNATLAMPSVGLAVQGGSANVIVDDNLIKVRALRDMRLVASSSPMATLLSRTRYSSHAV